MNRITAYCAVLCCGMAFAGDPAKGLEFMMDFRSHETNITSTSVGNALDVSGVSPPEAVIDGGSCDTNKVHLIPVKSVVPMYPWQTNDVYALHLPQRTRYDESNGEIVKKVNPVAISFTNSAIKSERQTTYIRFRWGGPLDREDVYVAWLILNGYNWNATGEDGTAGTGWGIGMSYKKGSDPATAYLSWMIPTKTQIFNWDSAISIEQDVWYDMFIMVEPNPDDGTKSRTTVSVLKPTSLRNVDGESVYNIPSFQTLTITGDFKKPTYSDSHSSLRIGAEASSSGFQSQTVNYGSYSKAFRGDVARLMTWSRLLSEDEKWQVMSGAWGGSFRLGLENGSADEFSGTVSGGNVWTPTNSWSSAGRCLTMEKPSLTIRSAVPDSDAGVGKILHVKPLPANGALPVEVSVNGESIGVYDLSSSSSRAIHVPGEKWRNDDDGHVEIKIERKAPFETALEIDSVSLGGGWRQGGSMTREGFVRSHHFIGTGDPRAVQRATTIHASYSYPSVSFSAWIPDDALAMFRHSFAVAIRGGNANDIPHAFWVNGQKFAEFDSSAEGEVMSADVPPGFLKAGENVFSVSNCVPVSSSVKWVRYSEYLMTVKRVYGLSVVIR